MAQEKMKEPVKMMVLYPEIYQVIELEESRGVLLVDLINFCEEQELKLVQKGAQLILFKIYPSFLGVEKATMDLEEKMVQNIGPHAKIKSIKSYGREYLPEEFHPFISTP
ncbi:hypothetical protein ACFSKL_05250 [Belliella marina]|uniref:Uncharacterized protein n=1 Tax=Belliella marina TaxID=1644146 RepID=A0ABW4VKA3_9BACT